VKSFKHEVRSLCLPKTWANFVKIWSKCYRPLMGHETRKCMPKRHETSFVLSYFTHEQSVSLFKNESKAFSCCKLFLLVFICFSSSWSHVCPFECNPFPFGLMFLHESLEYLEAWNKKQEESLCQKCHFITNHYRLYYSLMQFVVDSDKLFMPFLVAYPLVFIKD